MMETSTSLSAGRHASPTPTPDFAAESQTRAATSRLSLSGWLRERMRDGWCGKTLSASSRAAADATLPLFFPNSPDGMWKSRMEVGGTRESSPTRPDVSAFRGECWTRDIPEFPHFRGRCRTEGAVSSLSDVVAPGRAPQKYCLAASYAEAMLARAERLGYSLPSVLEAVLRASVSR